MSQSADSKLKAVGGNSSVADASAGYLANSASEQLNSVQGGVVCPPGYKQTEVGVIPEDWLILTLEDMAISGGLVRGPFGGAIKKEHFVKSGFKVYEQRNAIYATLSLGEYYIDKNKFLELKRFSVQENDFIVSCSGTIGKIFQIPADAPEGVINQALLKITLKDSISLEYFIQYFKWDKFQEKIIDGTQGGAMKNLVGMAEFKNSLMPMPSAKSEQAAIANALSDVDALISELKKLIAKKQAIKTATMQQLLTGRTRLPQFALREDGTPKNSSGTNLDAGAGGPKGEGQDGLRKGTKPSELGEIPEDWDAIKMGDLAKIQRGASPRPIDSPIWFERNSTVGWLRISDVTKTSKYLTETTQSLSELGIANSRFVPENNLVMSICATVGKPIITKKDLCIHDGFVVFNGLSVNQDFMYYILKELEDEWGKQGQTGSQMNLNTELINGTYVSVPKDAVEQAGIATILSDMDEELQALEQRLSKTRQIKQGMMQELLTGRIRLIKPSKEVIHE